MSYSFLLLVVGKQSLTDWLSEEYKNHEIVIRFAWAICIIKFHMLFKNYVKIISIYAGYIEN